MCCLKGWPKLHWESKAGTISRHSVIILISIKVRGSEIRFDKRLAEGKKRELKI